MMVHVYLEIKGDFDSRKLYENIKHYGVNLTDLNDVVLVYGDLCLAQVPNVIYNCALFGNVKADITH